MKIRTLGLQSYQSIFQTMKDFTSTRHPNTEDEIWILQHPAVYTQGQAGKPEHILFHNDIPIIQSDRGGQVTYHGPGQLIAYVLLNIQRRKLGIRTLVCQLEETLIQTLKSFDIAAQTQCGAPGVYVEEKKIASIGLRVKNGCTYHGIALNVDMDLSPFHAINPCGYQALKMTQVKDYDETITLPAVQEQLSNHLLTQFGN